MNLNMIFNNQYLNANNRIAIALGDPSGIGIEVTLKALGSIDLPKNMQPLLVGCKQTVEFVHMRLKDKGVFPLADPKNIPIEDLPFKYELIAGAPNSATGEASFKWLKRACEFVIKKEAKALVTAPISKHFWQLAGYKYAGQTELLGELSGVKNPSMLFTAISPYSGWRINTLLATTHIPLNEVSINLNPKIMKSKLDDLLSFCKNFKKNPRILISGLNPHAGENGQLGLEEIDWMIPTIKEWKKANPEVIIDGPISPDVCWVSTAKAWKEKTNKDAPDGILSMYHDQGLIPLKILAFDSAVNTTLGLPFVRTSPDHGTGFDIAGKGIANHESMLSAIKTGWDLSR